VQESVIVLVVLFFSYEQHQFIKDPMKQSVPQKFAGTMEFVKEYLEDVVSQSWDVADREQNQLTFQVFVSSLLLTTEEFPLMLCSIGICSNDIP